jgi:hypothetical protein
MRGVGLLFLACWIVVAQPAFEVASVKPTYALPGGRVFVFNGPSLIILSGNSPPAAIWLALWRQLTNFQRSRCQRAGKAVFNVRAGDGLCYRVGARCA